MIIIISCLRGSDDLGLLVLSPPSELEQLEHLRSEDTLRHLMITHSIYSHWIPSQNKTKSKLQILRICQNFKFLIFDTPSDVAW